MSIRLGILAPALLLAICVSACGPSKSASAVATPAPQALAPALRSAAPQQPPAAPPPTQQSSAQQERVKSLIAEVEKAYATGQADYKKGDLVAARSDFDHAVDLMLTSGIDIKSTPDLQDEFD